MGRRNVVVTFGNRRALPASLKGSRHLLSVLGFSAMLLLSACGGKKDDNQALLQRINELTGQANQLRDAMENAKKNCAQRSAEVQMALAMSSSGTMSPGAHNQLLMMLMGGGGPGPGFGPPGFGPGPGPGGPGGPGGGAPSIDACTNSLVNYFLVAKSLQEKDFAERDAKQKKELENAWAKNEQYRRDAIVFLLQNLRDAAGAAALNPVQLLQVAQRYGSQIPMIAAQFGLSQGDIMPLLAEVNGIQNRAVMLMAAGVGQPNNGNNNNGIANGGSLGINAGSGVGGGMGGMGPGVPGGGMMPPPGYGNRPPQGQGVASGAGLGIAGRAPASGGSRLNLNMGSGNRAAMRQTEELAQLDGQGVLNLQRRVGDSSWFLKHRKPRTTTAH
jgi:hypothetical protein